MKQDELSAESWRIIGELVERGRATLSDGTEVAPNSKTLVALYQWVAGLKKEKNRDIPLPEDFFAGGAKHGQDPAQPSVQGAVEGPPSPADS